MVRPLKKKTLLSVSSIQILPFQGAVTGSSKFFRLIHPCTVDSKKELNILSIDYPSVLIRIDNLLLGVCIRHLRRENVEMQKCKNTEIENCLKSFKNRKNTIAFEKSKTESHFS